MVHRAAGAAKKVNIKFKMCPDFIKVFIRPQIVHLISLVLVLWGQVVDPMPEFYRVYMFFSPNLFVSNCLNPMGLGPKFSILIKQDMMHRN